MRLVVGLGNPGVRYSGTRHNVGYEVVDLLAGRHSFAQARAWKRSLVSRGRMVGTEVLLAKPTTYMNMSGEAVAELARYYRQEPGEVLVIHDELDFDPGTVRIKTGGGHGGHKGLRSIVAHVGAEFVRVRVGIGKPPPGREGADYVLSRFDGASRQKIDEAVLRAAEAVEALLSDGVGAAMNSFNRREEASEDKPAKGRQVLDATQKDR